MGYLIFSNHMDLACSFALKDAPRARLHAKTAYSMAVRLRRPDMAAKANELLAAI